jgi:hypothetical protein
MDVIFLQFFRLGIFELVAMETGICYKYFGMYQKEEGRTLFGGPKVKVEFRHLFFASKTV